VYIVGLVSRVSCLLCKEWTR